jgi:hypothetical protein
MVRLYRNGKRLERWRTREGYVYVLLENGKVLFGGGRKGMYSHRYQVSEFGCHANLEQVRVELKKKGCVKERG